VALVVVARLMVVAIAVALEIHHLHRHHKEAVVEPAKEEEVLTLVGAVVVLVPSAVMVLLVAQPQAQVAQVQPILFLVLQ
jgi:hypothetical protein